MEFIKETGEPWRILWGRRAGEVSLVGAGAGWRGQPGHLWAAPRPTESWSHRVCLGSSPLSLASCLTSFLLFLWCLNHEIAKLKIQTFFFYIYLLCYMCYREGVHVPRYSCGSPEDNFRYLGPKVQTQVLSLGGRRLYPLRPLAGPGCYF